MISVRSIPTQDSSVLCPMHVPSFGNTDIGHGVRYATMKVHSTQCTWSIP